MPVYQPSPTGTIGTLLRGIQEDRQVSPIANPPQAQPGSPTRELIQAPLQQVEAPESARVIATRPETAPIINGAPLAPIVAPAGAAAAAPAPSIIAPVASYDAPSESGFEGFSPSGPSAPSAQGPSVNSPSAPISPGAPSRPVSLATQIRASAPQPGPVYGPPVPQRSAPAPQPQNAPGLSRIGQYIVDLGTKLFGGFLPQPNQNKRYA